MAKLQDDPDEIYFEGTTVDRLTFVATTAQKIQGQHYMCEPEDAIRKAELLFATLKKRVAQWRKLEESSE